MKNTESRENKKNTNEVSDNRRTFLKAGAVTLASAPFVASAQTFEGKNPSTITWDDEMDILTVGTGVGGLTSAITAAEKDSSLKIVVIEKMARLGGSSLISGLNMAVVGSPWQKEIGVQDDTPEKFFKDIDKEAKGYNHAELTKTLSENSLTVYDFFVKHGIKFDKSVGNGTGIKKLGGHSVPRTVWPLHGGVGVIGTLLEFIKEKLPNTTVKSNVLLEEIYRNEQGRVIGVRVRENYRFDLTAADFGKNDDPSFNSTGVVKNYKVKRSLIMATGGFNRDAAFRGDEIGVMRNAASTTNPGATAGALKAMMQAGFKPIHMTLFRFAFPIPTEDIVWGLLLNPRTCRRFIDEFSNNDRQALGLAILAERRKIDDDYTILIYDQNGIDNYHDKQRLNLSLEAKNGTDGTIWKFETLEALADNFKMDINKLKETIKEYNENMEKDADEFGKPKAMMGSSVNFNKAPFYAMHLNPRYNYTQGGAMITPEARPVDIVTGEPIPGAFVCGEASAGTFGYIRLTACSCLDCATFGIIAGENAAKESPWA